MKESTNKEKILKALRNALLTKTSEVSCADSSSSFYKIEDKDLSIAFAKTFTLSGNSLYYCTNEEELHQHLVQIVSSLNENITCYNEVFHNFIQSFGIPNVSLAETNKSYPLGIMLCENLIAQDGSITFTEKQGYHSTLTTFPEIFIVLGFTSQVVDTYKASINQIRIRYTENSPKYILTLGADTLNTENISKLIVLLVEDQQL